MADETANVIAIENEDSENKLHNSSNHHSSSNNL